MSSSGNGERPATLAATHPLECVIDAVQAAAFRRERFEVEPALLPRADQSRHLDIGIRRAVHASDQRSSEMEDLKRAELGTVVAAADADHDGAATAPRCAPRLPDRRRTADALDCGI